MSNELLTKLMDPFVEGVPNTMQLLHSDGFGDEEQNEALCTWVAKWYLDGYLKDWRDFEDKGVITAHELGNILIEKNIESEFRLEDMGDCKRMLHAIGIGRIDVLDDVRTDLSFDFIVQVHLRDYLVDNAETILDKIQAIYAARNEQAIDEADRDAVICNNLADLRDPLNKDDINIFDLMPVPKFGDNESDITTDDYILWFAKDCVANQYGMKPAKLRKLWCGSYSIDFDTGGTMNCLQCVCLFGAGRVMECGFHAQIDDLAQICLGAFYDENEDKIISKVKEIMKLWLEHDLL